MSEHFVQTNQFLYYHRTHVHALLALVMQLTSFTVSPLGIQHILHMCEL